MKNLFLIAVIVLGFSAASFGQSTATASASATLVTPISIGLDDDMDFGTIAASNTQGTIALEFNNDRTEDGGASAIATTPGQCAVFTVSGSLTESITVSVPESAITLTGITPGVTVSDFEADCGETTSLVAGTKTIIVKATLNVPANVAAGTYTNTTGLAVTVNYN